MISSNRLDRFAIKEIIVRCSKQASPIVETHLGDDAIKGISGNSSSGLIHDGEQPDQRLLVTVRLMTVHSVTIQ